LGAPLCGLFLFRVKTQIFQEENIARLNELLTMHLGPQDVLVNLSLDFTVLSL